MKKLRSTVNNHGDVKWWVSEQLSLFILNTWVFRGRLSSLIGSFSNDDGDGSKNVTFKMNSRVFTVLNVYSNSLKMSNVGEFLWSWLLGDCTQV